jgi:hypothetical protein
MRCENEIVRWAGGRQLGLELELGKGSSGKGSHPRNNKRFASHLNDEGRNWGVCIPASTYPTYPRAAIRP